MNSPAILGGRKMLQTEYGKRRRSARSADPIGQPKPPPTILPRVTPEAPNRVFCRVAGISLERYTLGRIQGMKLRTEQPPSLVLHSRLTLRFSACGKL